jgi:hypothetical protein
MSQSARPPFIALNTSFRRLSVELLGTRARLGAGPKAQAFEQADGSTLFSTRSATSLRSERLRVLAEGGSVAAGAHPGGSTC